MAVAKRSGPDFLFLANANSQKFTDIETNKITNLYFHDSSTQDWISVTGETVTSDNSDPRIKEVYNKYVSAWFGDLGDGKHTGGPEDPRMKLIEVQPKCTFTLPFTSLHLLKIRDFGGEPANLQFVQIYHTGNTKSGNWVSSRRSLARLLRGRLRIRGV